MFTLINEIQGDVEHQRRLQENISVIFDNEEQAALFERADKYIGKAIASLRASKNPVEQGTVDPDILAALDGLGDPDLQDALVPNERKRARALSVLDRNAQVQKALKDMGATRMKSRAAAIRKQAAENPKELASHLEKLQMRMSQAQQAAAGNQE
jgi:hypothetical protein